MVLRPTAFHSFARRFLPWLAVSALEKAMVNVPATFETALIAAEDALRGQKSRD